ncbi:hypothetical protein GQ44DRAFT_732037 [Phaeosphaeriaceae sp. PMI808]|nr:hypothetical protein GQ44DRAFT_732326 [Phaeosphaeriaceae sp. PMI808]KAH8707003.1 hypothetical protein GQ44DRAFT_732037 [Phaeosphaeriaceae sp. PMI808]
MTDRPADNAQDSSTPGRQAIIKKIVVKDGQAVVYWKRAGTEPTTMAVEVVHSNRDWESLVQSIDYISPPEAGSERSVELTFEDGQRFVVPLADATAKCPTKLLNYLLSLSYIDSGVWDYPGPTRYNTPDDVYTLGHEYGFPKGMVGWVSYFANMLPKQPPGSERDMLLSGYKRGCSIYICTILLKQSTTWIILRGKILP